jgi:ribonuclease HI
MDYQVLVRCVTGPGMDTAAWAGTVMEIQAAFNLMPQFWVMHACREANRAAHELVKMGMQKRDCVVM